MPNGPYYYVSFDFWRVTVYDEAAGHGKNERSARADISARAMIS
jgi:hypothetical protein